MLKSILSYFI